METLRWSFDGALIVRWRGEILCNVGGGRAELQAAGGRGVAGRDEKKFREWGLTLRREG
jgi:hypothetical protein